MLFDVRRHSVVAATGNPRSQSKSFPALSAFPPGMVPGDEMKAVVASPMRVIVAHDKLVTRAGLVTLLATRGVNVVGQAADGGQAVELAERLRPDVVLLEVRLPGVDGVTAAGRLSEITRVLMLSDDADADIVTAALCAGAAGYLVHGAFGAGELVAAVRDAMSGRAAPLSPAAGSALVEALRDLRQRAVWREAALTCADALSQREIEVMDLVAQGHSNADIARALSISAYTVKNHINRIFTKLDVRTRTAAMAAWLGTARPSPRPRRTTDAHVEAAARPAGDWAHETT